VVERRLTEEGFTTKTGILSAGNHRGEDRGKESLKGCARRRRAGGGGRETAGAREEERKKKERGRERENPLRGGIL